MDQPLVDHRLDPRVRQPEIAGTQAILRPGYAVSLIDLSAGGALIEGPRPLRPGARVHLQIVTATRRHAITAHVLRCAVSSIDPRHGVQYRGALKFDHRCDAFWEATTPDGYALPPQPPVMPDSGGERLPGDHAAPNTGHERRRE